MRPSLLTLPPESRCSEQIVNIIFELAHDADFQLSPSPAVDMDAAIDLSDASKALDLANIRFQLM